MFMTFGTIFVVMAWLIWDCAADSDTEGGTEIHEQWFI